MLATSGLVLAGVSVVDQGVDVSFRNGIDVATTAAITTTWPPFGDKFFATKRHDAVAAVAGLDFDLRFINEFHDCPYVKAKKPRQAGFSVAAVEAPLLRLDVDHMTAKRPLNRKVDGAVLQGK